MKLLRSEIGLELSSAKGGKVEETLGAEAVGRCGGHICTLCWATARYCNGHVSQSMAMVAWAEAREFQGQSSLGVCGGADLLAKSSDRPVLLISQGTYPS